MAQELISHKVLSRDYLSKDNPYMEAVVDFSYDGSDAELNCAENDPAFSEKSHTPKSLMNWLSESFIK